ncbi:33287_t:CDS:1, partial [Racocetra persica]
MNYSQIQENESQNKILEELFLRYHQILKYYKCDIEVAENSECK